MVTVVEREAAWLNADPAVLAAVGDVLAYFRSNVNGQTVAVLSRTGYTRQGLSTGFDDVTHDLRLSLAWQVQSADFDLVDAQRDLDEALSVLEARICHPDLSHGGRWETAATQGQFRQAGLTVTVEDAANAPGLAADGVISCSLLWTVTERVSRPYLPPTP